MREGDAASAGMAASEVEPGLLQRQADGSVALTGGRCGQCGAYAVRVLPVCPECWAEGSLVVVALSRVGRVASSFVAHTAPPGFTAPYGFALVDLPEGLRVLMRVAAGAGGTIAIGDEVEVEEAELGRTPAGAPLTGPLFRGR